MGYIRATVSDANEQDLNLIKEKVLGVKHMGQVIESLLHHARITGFCAGMRADDKTSVSKKSKKKDIKKG